MATGPIDYGNQAYRGHALFFNPDYLKMGIHTDKMGRTGPRSGRRRLLERRGLGDTRGIPLP
jgi:hypothetical protein